MRPPAPSNAAGKRRMAEPDAPVKEARWEPAVADARDPQLDASLELARRLQAEEDALAERRRAQAKAAALLGGESPAVRRGTACPSRTAS